MITPGRLSIIIDGQFGSTGKGLIASYVGQNPVDITITNSSPNAGHTFYTDKKNVTKHLPVTGLLNKKSIIYLCAGTIIDPHILLGELKRFNVRKERVYIHPRCAVIEKEDLAYEKNGPVKKIASTRSGVGSALARKINRSARLAKDNPLLKGMVRKLNVSSLLQMGKTAVMEVPQGFDLSINSGLSYPHCTSREVTVTSALSDVQVHPDYLGSVLVCIRTYPIRVGHIVENGKIVGDSGPFYSDSVETSWKEIGVDPEYTTNTKRIRRVATFSLTQYKRMLEAFKPTHVFLNFANYLSKTALKELLNKLPEVTHVCYGPRVKDVVPVTREKILWSRLGVKRVILIVGGEEKRLRR